MIRISLTFLPKYLWATAVSAVGLWITTSAFSAPAPESVAITLLHTNDLHSHFRPDRSPLRRGGLARIKTAVDRIRKQAPNVVLVDGGDWSEGTIYYTQGVGAETIRLMDHVGYDMAVVGNHDFLNGPDALLEAFESAAPRHLTHLAANVDGSAYPNWKKLKKFVQPYVIKEFGNFKVAFIGLATFELIYDKFFSPVEIYEPFLSTSRLASELKDSVNAVVVISHNSTLVNEWVLKMATDVDLVIGAHDHVKHDRAVEVSRPGRKPGFIVETGFWGRYLGRVDLVVSKANVFLKNYNLIQMDLTVPEDPETVQKIESIEDRIRKQYGPIFEDHVADNHMVLVHQGQQNYVSNLVTDAFLKNSGADFSFDIESGMYGELFPGPVTTADIFNVYPAIYNGKTQKTWTLRKVPIKGSTLAAFLNLIYASNKLQNLGSFVMSGLSFTFDPIFLATARKGSMSHVMTPEELMIDPRALDLKPLTEDDLYQIESIPAVKDIRIQGVPLDRSKTYMMAAGGIILEALRVMNSVITVVPLDGIQDTGIEMWRHIENYLRAHQQIKPELINLHERATPYQADLGIYPEGIRWEPLEKIPSKGVRGKITVQVTNYGRTISPASSPSKGPRIEFSRNRNGIDESLRDYKAIAPVIPIHPLLPGRSQEYTAEIIVGEDRGFLPLTISLLEGSSRTAPANKQVTGWFNANDIRGQRQTLLSRP